MPQYHLQSYWDARYSRDCGNFDWYQNYTSLAPIISKYFNPEEKMLQVGCGTSRLSQDMVQRGGFKHIMNVDYSNVVVSHMKELHKSIAELLYLEADVRSMTMFQDNSFDGIIDKGTLDAILCGDQSVENTVGMMEECYRVIKPGCTMLLITYGDPASRLAYLDDADLRTNWQVEVYCLVKPESPAVSSVSGLCGSSLPAKEAPVVIKGPFSAMNDDMMDSLSQLEGVHFVYALTKPAADGDAAHRAGARST